MGFWSYYFFLKLFLLYGQFIGFHVWLNFLLAVFVALPLPQRWMRTVRLLLALPAGVALLYHDSFLPPFSRLLKTSGDLSAFTPAYLLDLLLRFVNPGVLLGLLLMLLLWLLLAHRLRMASFAFAGILTAPLVLWLQQAHVAAPVVVAASTGAAEPQALTQQDLTTRLNNFYAAEKPRRVHFAPGAGPDYDLILLHTCSLSWDDVNLVEQRNDRLFGRFDVLMTHFNSAASYSGPAAVRLLRGACGQPAHEALYQPLQPECALMGQLAQAGFEPAWSMSHDGVFGNFVQDVERNLGVPVTLDLDSGARVAQRAFDGSPIYGDYDVLSRWWERRLKRPGARVALYYNTSSLHDGNRIEGVARLAPKESYERRLRELLGDYNRFIDLVEKSGRRAVVVLVPEHGAAVRGDRLQISGLREIPTPAISQVPLGLKLVGPGWTGGAQQVVDSPVSYLALSELLSRLVAGNPFAPGYAGLAGPVQELPQTESIAENDGTVVMQVGSGYQMRGPDGSWAAYDTRPQ